MMVWEEEEIMEEKVVDQTDINNLEDTEVTTFNALSSRVLGNLGGINIKTPRDLGAGQIQQPRQRSIWTGYRTVKQQPESGEELVTESSIRVRAELMYRRVWLLV
jgi:hypothetical protein